jgi:hypothetical protein
MKGSPARWLVKHDTFIHAPRHGIAGTNHGWCLPVFPDDDAWRQAATGLWFVSRKDSWHCEAGSIQAISLSVSPTHTAIGDRESEVMTPKPGRVGVRSLLQVGAVGEHADRVRGLRVEDGGRRISTRGANRKSEFGLCACFLFAPLQQRMLDATTADEFPDPESRHTGGRSHLLPPSTREQMLCMAVEGGRVVTGRRPHRQLRNRRGGCPLLAWDTHFPRNLETPD